MYYERCSKSSSGGTGDGRILKNRPILVAASVGSYGAYLADGSEYRCVYHLCQYYQVMFNPNPILLLLGTLPLSVIFLCK